MLKTTISNHPHFSGVTRTAEVIGLSFGNDIKLELKVEHFIDGNKVGDMDKMITLLLNNEKQYLMGNQTIGDFEAFVMQAEMGESFKTMVQQGIHAVDQDGTINSKCSYSSVLVEVPVEPEE